MILNRQRGVRVPIRQLDAFLAQACNAVRISPEAVSVCLVDNIEIARWNRSYRGKNRPTDVLSFPAQAGKTRRGRKKGRQGSAGNFHPKDDPSISFDGYLGDIAIAPAAARANAKELGRKFNVEMRILILHGILHLMGYDHETDSGQMERREMKLRRALGLAK